MRKVPLTLPSPLGGEGWGEGAETQLAKRVNILLLRVI